jgi:hypothetical protein
MALEIVSSGNPQKKSLTAVPIPKASPHQISQEELEEVILLRNKQECLATLEVDLLQRLLAGASVEEGVHTARIKFTLDVR